MKTVFPMIAVTAALAVTVASCASDYEHRHAQRYSEGRYGREESEQDFSMHFVHKASAAGAFEIRSSRLALDKSHDDMVRKFARRMIHDHTMASSQLAAAVATSSVDASAVANEPSARQHEVLNDLEDRSGRDFDAHYIEAQVKAHEHAVRLFDDYAQHGQDQSLRDFAGQTLPTLQAHLAHAKRLEANY